MSSPEGGIFLIVNADDFNLTSGVSRGILEAFDHGVVTSTSVLIHRPIPGATLQALKRRRSLGVGLHLNITWDRPLCDPKDVSSLVDARGYFKNRRQLDLSRVVKAELAREYERQIQTFRQIVGKWPSHLDTHHHLHEHPALFGVLVELALRFRLPIRQCRLLRGKVRQSLLKVGVRLTDRLVEDLDFRHAWNEKSLEQALLSLDPGYHELMCHPAICDRKLLERSSFNRPREEELRALCSPRIRSLVRRREIQLISFRDLRLARAALVS